jgi:hypothetical protein
MTGIQISTRAGDIVALRIIETPEGRMVWSIFGLSIYAYCRHRVLGITNHHLGKILVFASSKVAATKPIKINAA